MYGLGIAWRLAILLVATVGPPGLKAEGNVGCLFSESLCIDQEEWCYDDHAFGRCLPGFGSVVDEDLYTYDLDRETLHTCEREMHRLFALGYRWSHPYTQCELQAMLFAARNNIEFDNTVCSHLVDQDLEGALMSLENGDMVDPDSTAYVKYTPSDSNPNAEFADEIYFPRDFDPLQMENQREDFENRIEPEYVQAITRLYPPEKRIWLPAMHRRSPRLTIPYPTEFFQSPENEVDFDKLERYIPYLDYLNGMKFNPEDVPIIVPNEKERNGLDELVDVISDYMEAYQKQKAERTREKIFNDWVTEENLRYLENLGPQEPVLPRIIPEPRRFSQNYNTPDKFRDGYELRDEISPANIPELFDQRVYIDENEDFQEQEPGSGENTHPTEIFRELKQRDLQTNNLPAETENSETPTIFTEGGPLYPQLGNDNSKELEQILKNDLGKFLDEYDWGFKRRERLDVKKPGPPFDERLVESTEVQKPVIKPKSLPKTPEKTEGGPNPGEGVNLGGVSSEGGDIPEERTLKRDEIPKIKKSPRGGTHPDPMHDLVNFDVDTDFVYIGLKDSVTTWRTGNEIIWHISNLLGLDQKTFSHIRVGRNEVTFRVEPNKQGLNATDVATKIDTIKDRLKKDYGIEIVSAGVGDMVKMPAVMTVKPSPSIQMHFMLMIFCGILAAILLGVLVLVIIRSQVLSRKKLHNLAQQDTEASKDYQDLCRARMATKGQQPVSEKSEGVHGRITSLSRESEGSQHSPSSRSSTSSWSEEPSLTNMDISTGHMVLTYMEDHLKNKDRLEQEWVALCAYEAEPCSTAIALKPENVKKNRYMEILPYDHSRVVLNELANASNTDYINASSITDHDPRNPAYIATQGPLPHTAPDFWQMVWEQGSVVMVMLTRLTENGNAMCHRYWPEEGSEVYHIYEVHLVSEHIWCDDYLVRSFYLKNVKTGETRTVTQFHFLSWPEHGIPTSTKALLEFRRKVNKSYRGRSCPIVVHCSDGAGRTGTYTLIDMVLNRMAKGAKEIDIAATLEHIRDQRMRMVATKQQFEFVLMAVAEEVHAILKALPAQIEKMEKANTTTGEK